MAEATAPPERTVDTFFSGRPAARSLFDRVEALTEAVGVCTMRVTKSQIAFARRRGFAWVWTPDRYLGAHATAPLVLSVALARRDDSARWKQIVEPRPGRWMHHLEIHSVDDLDAEVASWIGEAWALAA